MLNRFSMMKPCYNRFWQDSRMVLKLPRSIRNTFHDMSDSIGRLPNWKIGQRPNSLGTKGIRRWKTRRWKGLFSHCSALLPPLSYQFFNIYHNMRYWEFIMVYDWSFCEFWWRNWTEIVKVCWDRHWISQISISHHCANATTYHKLFNLLFYSSLLGKVVFKSPFLNI